MSLFVSKCWGLLFRFTCHRSHLVEIVLITKIFNSPRPPLRHLSTKIADKDYQDLYADKWGGESCNKYFDYDFSSLFKFCDKNGASLIKGKFENVLSSLSKALEIDDKLNILYIDCDLYESYLECLNNLYDNVVDGGSIIFDEYYSHKYPGARIAVNEFFENKKGYFEKYKTPEGFERWCFVKELK